MPSNRYKTRTEQVADEIRSRLQQGQWTGLVPGRQKLAAELGVNHKTCGAALKQLENEGLLRPLGNGLGRAVVKSVRLDYPSPASPSPAVRVRVLLYEKSDLRSDFLVELLHRLRQMGHNANFSGKTMKGMGMNMKRIIKHVTETRADAWIVLAGSHDLLHWFSERSLPTFALFGRMGSANIASIIPQKNRALDELVERLVKMGHQRIVMITREDRRKPSPGASERRFMDCLTEQGIRTSPYNLPDWGDRPDEMVKLLESLFRYTPPTAMILSEAPLFFAAMQWLSKRGMSAPEHVSLACMDPSPLFEWSRPEITHIHWGTTPLVNRMVNWVNNVSIGKDDRRKTNANAKLIVGGTIGPVPKQPLPGLK